MSSPEDKQKRKKRIRNRIARDLRTPKYRQRVKEDKTKKIELKDLSHAELVRLINKETDENPRD